MTGRRLYDKYCDAVAHTATHWDFDNDRAKRTLAWPFLSNLEQRAWTDCARRITPTPRKANP